MTKQQSAEEYDFATCALHVGQDASQWKSRAVVPPIVMATTFAQFEPAVTAVIFVNKCSSVYLILSITGI